MVLTSRRRHFNEVNVERGYNYGFIVQLFGLCQVSLCFIWVEFTAKN
jgi:hypothetical protein